jgi:hypothetical protein
MQIELDSEATQTYYLTIHSKFQSPVTEDNKQTVICLESLKDLIYAKSKRDVSTEDGCEMLLYASFKFFVSEELKSKDSNKLKWGLDLLSTLLKLLLKSEKTKSKAISMLQRSADLERLLLDEYAARPDHRKKIIYLLRCLLSSKTREDWESQGNNVAGL